MKALLVQDRCPAGPATGVARVFLGAVVLVASASAAQEPRGPAAADAVAARPNVLFLALDDLNDWVGCLGGHPQARTPNLDRLAASGVLFTNAHCPGPACNPSRTAIFSGRSPHRSGLYDNRQKMREVLPEAEILPKSFSRGGYWSAGSGKMLHYFIDAPSWDDYFPGKESENPFPRTLYPETRPLSLPRGGPWQYVETDWGPLDATDEEYGGDFLVAEWISAQLAREHEQPFFLACGFYRPHEPWFVPREYFEPFPLDSIQLPPGYDADDLDDLPPEGKRRGPNRYFAHIREQGQWKRGIQGYLASIHFADAMLGRVLDALDEGPNAADTIVVLWSDHGWHLGEKQHWQKYTAWRACTRVPLIVRVPPGAPGLAAGTSPGTCSKPVNLLSLYPSLLELCGLPARPEHDGPSLVPLLADPGADWPHVSVTHLGEPGSFGLSAERWRYIRYAQGDEELYDIQTDPHELVNLATREEHTARLAELRSRAPAEFAPKPAPSDEALSALTWHPAGGEPPPASKPDGDPFDVVFLNGSEQPVQLHWLDRAGEPLPYGEILPGGRRPQQTRPGAAWLVTDADGEHLGHFLVGDRAARAVIPSRPKARELTIGDPAPALDVAHWMKGDAVTTFTPGHVYVLEFWATWCGPCVANMEHLSEIQEAYAERGVTVIGLSDEPLQTTVRFLLTPSGPERASQDDRTRYTLATDPDRSVHRAYFEAAGQSGIPAVFVIGKGARIEWLGHPKDLAPVVAAVVDGSWDRDAHRERVLAEQAASRRLREARETLTDALEGSEWEAALGALDVLIEEGHDVYIPTKYGVLMSRMKQYERGYAYAREVLAQAWDSDAWVCYQLGWITSGAEKFPFDPAQRDLDFALKAAKRATELDPEYYYSTMLARIHSERREYAEAVRVQERAIVALEEQRPKIRPHEMESYDADLAALETDLAEYERLAKQR